MDFRHGSDSSRPPNLAESLVTPAAVGQEAEGMRVTRLVTRSNSWCKEGAELETAS